MKGRDAVGCSVGHRALVVASLSRRLGWSVSGVLHTRLPRRLEGGDAVSWSVSYASSAGWTTESFPPPRPDFGGEYASLEQMSVTLAKWPESSSCDILKRFAWMWCSAFKGLPTALTTVPHPDDGAKALVHIAIRLFGCASDQRVLQAVQYTHRTAGVSGTGAPPRPDQEGSSGRPT